MRVRVGERVIARKRERAREMENIYVQHFRTHGAPFKFDVMDVRRGESSSMTIIVKSPQIKYSKTRFFCHFFGTRKLFCVSACHVKMLKKTSRGEKWPPVIELQN